MIIAIDEKHKEIQNKLKDLGYTITNLDSKGKVDAVLYHSKYDKGFLNDINDFDLKSSTQGSGVLLIDICNKDIKRIHRILQDRLYTPLF
ncbi:MAG: YkuS family protein [Eubacteriaceae bacterium]